MYNVKVAVLDTGLDIHDEEVKDHYILKKELQLNDENIMDDFNGHGTLVAKTILNTCSNAKIYPIKIFNNSGKTNSYYVVEVLQKILTSDIKLINISASTFDSTYEKELKEICYKLKENNKIVICSKHNSIKSNYSIPTVFDSVIGVSGHKDIYDNHKYFYRKGEKIQMCANDKDYFIKFKNKVTHFGKNSKACAIATGIIANIVKDNQNISMTDLESILVNNSENEKNLDLKKIYDLDLNEKMFFNIKHSVLDVINSNFAKRKVDLNFVQKHSLFNNITDIGNYNAYELLKNINKYFKININYKDIFLYQLKDIDTISFIIFTHLN